MTRWASAVRAVLVLVGCGGQSPAAQPPASAAASPPVRLTLALGYIPNVQFAPFYVARERGFFRDEGLDVTFEHGQDPDLIKALGAGKFPFIVADADSTINARANGIPVTYVAAVYEQFPGAIISLASQPITAAVQLKGKRIGLPFLAGSSYVGVLGLLRSAGLTDKDVDLQAIGFNQAAQLIQGKVDAVIGFANNDALQVQAATGAKPAVLMIGDVVPMIGSGLVTNDETLRSNSGQVQGMVRAVTRGLQYTADHQEEAFGVSAKYVPEMAGANLTLNRDILAATAPLWRNQGTAVHGLGWTDPVAWQAMADTMVRAGLLRQPPVLEQLATNRFIDPALK